MQAFSQSVTLEDVDVQKQVRALRGAISEAKRVYIVTGAGISVSAGIPVKLKLNIRTFGQWGVYTPNYKRNTEKRREL